MRRDRLLTSAITSLVATACATPAGDETFIGVIRKALSETAEHWTVQIISAAILIAAGICYKIILSIMRRAAPVRLPAKWKTTIERGAGSGAKEHETATLHQFGPWVWGKTTTKTNPPRIYRLRGRICGSNLSLRYREDETFDIGAAILAIRQDRTMSGIEIGIDAERNVVASFNYMWTPADQ
jgi:hypothetical protein